jgi:hypothetical protein
MVFGIHWHPNENGTIDHFTGFLEKVKSGNAKQAGSGFGGKGLDKLDKERDAKERAQRSAYGEGEDGKVEEKTEVATGEKETKGRCDDHWRYQDRDQTRTCARYFEVW